MNGQVVEVRFFFFCGEFSAPGEKKRAGESNKGIFENFF
jgi:hypothetical protein